jgi:8-oxo-dGTP pyrophosphatase MutT (NUDIX family)
MTELAVVRIDALDLAFEPRSWEFASVRRAEIDAHFAMLSRAKPSLFNGRVLVMHRYEIVGATLRGAFLEIDFASYVAWRDWNFPDATMRNCFALGALRGSDGGYLLGVMGAHTANAGRIYFPGGTPDPSDVLGRRVDLEASVRRELSEETGLSAAELEFAPGWTAVLAGARIALLKTMQASEPAAALRDRILANIAAQADPELAGMHVVRSLDDLDDRMPPFIHAFFHHLWRAKVGSASHPATEPAA